jgi:beta-glucosidase
LINKVAATGTPVIVLLVGGSAITMSHWIEKVQSVVQLWYPGEAGGLAVADLLFGDYNPAGRLPITFPVFEGQLPLVYNHKPTGRGDDYVNLTGQALFPFGFGLSYTTFEYSNLTLDKNECLAGDTVIVSCTVTNTGNLAGDEVVQLYLTDELASVARPVKELRGFKRIHLDPGESTEVSLALTPDAFEMLDKNMKKTIEPGNFRLMVGASSKDIRLRSLIRITDNSRK